MAAKVPAVLGEAGFVDPIDSMYIGPLATTETYLVNGSIANKFRFSQRTVYFADIDNGDTWVGVPGIKACAWQPNDVDATTAPAVSADANGLVTFVSSGSNHAGWLHLWIDDPDFRYGKRIL